MWRGLGIHARDQRVSALDRLQFLQHRLLARLEAIAPHPLDVADPDRRARQFRGVGIDFDALRRCAARNGSRAAPAHVSASTMARCSRSFSDCKREIEKVAGAAGGIEHANVAGASGKRRAAPVATTPCSGPPSRVRPLDGCRSIRLRRLPFRRQRPHDHRLDDHHDLFGIGVVRADLRPLVGIEDALEQRAEDGRVDRRPVLLGDRAACRARRRERQGLVVVEQAAVEVRICRRRNRRRSRISRTGRTASLRTFRDLVAPLRQRVEQRLNRSSCSRSTSSANRQNTIRFRKCATFSGAWPFIRSRSAMAEKSLATSLVTCSRVFFGCSRSGWRKTFCRSSRVPECAMSSIGNSCRS